MPEYFGLLGNARQDFRQSLSLRPDEHDERQAREPNERQQPHNLILSHPKTTLKKAEKKLQFGLAPL
jgi:hypothetical protein